jgi:putative methyltransferase (TIGR04325 family)
VIDAPVWEGVFTSWQEACAAAAPPDASFSSDRWLARVAAQLTDYRRDREQHGTALPPRPSNLPWLAALSRPSRIVDFGGSSGWCWDYLQASVPNLPVTSYIIVEQPALVEYAREAGLHGPPVTYTSDAAALGPCDLLYCNSVLQYFGSNGPLLNLVVRTRPRHVLLDDLLANADADSFSTQRYYDTAMPHRFVGLARLRADMRDCGYRMIVAVPHLSPIRGVLGELPMSNLPPSFRVRYSSSVLFERAGEP